VVVPDTSIVLATKYMVFVDKSITGVLSMPTFPTMLRESDCTTLTIGIGVTPAAELVKLFVHSTPFPLVAFESASSAYTTSFIVTTKRTL
jgi:hypothetical protein